MLSRASTAFSSTISSVTSIASTIAHVISKTAIHIASGTYHYFVPTTLSITRILFSLGKACYTWRPFMDNVTRKKNHPANIYTLPIVLLGTLVINALRAILFFKKDSASSPKETLENINKSSEKNKNPLPRKETKLERIIYWLALIFARGSQFFTSMDAYLAAHTLIQLSLSILRYGHLLHKDTKIEDNDWYVIFIGLLLFLANFYSFNKINLERVNKNSRELGEALVTGGYTFDHAKQIATPPTVLATTAMTTFGFFSTSKSVRIFPGIKNLPELSLLILAILAASCALFTTFFTYPFSLKRAVENKNTHRTSPCINATETATVPFGVVDAGASGAAIYISAITTAEKFKINPYALWLIITAAASGVSYAALIYAFSTKETFSDVVKFIDEVKAKRQQATDQQSKVSAEQPSKENLAPSNTVSGDLQPAQKEIIEIKIAQDLSIDSKYMSQKDQKKEETKPFIDKVPPNYKRAKTVEFLTQDGSFEKNKKNNRKKQAHTLTLYNRTPPKRSHTHDTIVMSPL